MKRVMLLGLVLALVASTAWAVETKTKSNEFVGEVASINAKMHSLVVKGSTETKAFLLESDIVVTDEVGGAKVDLAQLKAGDRVKVMYTEADGRLIASALERMTPKTASNTTNNK